MITDHWFVILFFVKIVNSDTHARTWQGNSESPCDNMVNVINNLGLNILKVHNENNENNIALSPYGAATILVVLLEGTKGGASLEIKKYGGFPKNMDIIRIGLRDIHRLLRSYFIPQEGFLSGLSLNSDEVILRPEYQSILRFYGFEITTFNTSPAPNITTTTTMSDITTETTETTTEKTTIEVQTSSSTTEIPTTEKTTTEPPTTTTEKTTKETPTTKQINLTIPVATKPTINDETLTNLTTINNINENETLPTTTTQLTTTTLPGTTQTTLSNEQVTTGITSTDTADNELNTTLSETLITTTQNSESPQLTTETTETITTAMPTTIETTNANIPLTSQIPVIETIKSIISSLTTTQMMNLETQQFDSDTTISSLENVTKKQMKRTIENIKQSKRVKKSLVDYIINLHYDTNNPNISKYSRTTNRYGFLVNGELLETHVNFMTYDALLPFFYVHSLESLALKLPLDSPKYYLLLILPVDNKGVDQLICDIGNVITLKQIISHLRPTYVRAVIPSFTFHGFVSLTSSLEKIGIRRIFQPYQSDFSPVTDENNIFVTNIEQAIKIIIKNYKDLKIDDNGSNTFQHYESVKFEAIHPFLYFVMDTETDVTLVAGKVVNPLNTRIQ